MAYKVEVKASDYPTHDLRWVPLQTGDSFYISDNVPVAIGEIYNGDSKLYISDIYYEPKAWWQFLKKKKQIGYKVTCR